jgi:ABC-type lipoprotein release transport system permease subunit
MLEAIVVVAALAVAALVSIWPSRRASRLRPAAILRSE